MARDRQKAKQRKAKKLAQEQKRAQRKATDAAERSEQREERLEEIEDEGVGREAMTGSGIAAEVQLDQARMDAELTEARQEAEAEISTGGDDGEEVVEKTKRGRRRRAEAAEKTREASKQTARGRRDGAGQAKQAKRKTRERGRVVGFFVQVWAELKRVQWPTRNQVWQATGVVLGFCVIAGLYLAAWDFVWSEVVKRVF